MKRLRRLRNAAGAEYARPVIDSARDEVAPIPHHRVSGHFDGTDKRFTLYYPPKDQWDGRFFQHVHPMYGENADDDTMRFAADSGGYLIQTNGGGGYRLDAAAAEFSKVIAQHHYRTSDRIFGYLWGGSGGSYQVISAMENTAGVWDGAVPYIPGDPTSIPNNFFIRALARLVLRDKAAQIADAVAPGSHTDPYANLNAVEHDILAEITRMGLPLPAWEDYRYALGMDAPDALLGFSTQVTQIDPSYVDDFWSVPGYLGTEQSPLGTLVRAARIEQTVKVAGIEQDLQAGCTRITIDSTVASPAGAPLNATIYEHDGVTVRATFTGMVDAESNIIVSEVLSQSILDAIERGAPLRLDNRTYLAMCAYPRHQVPVRAGFTAYEQYRRPGGTPLYPQRPVLVGPVISESVSEGGRHTGKINGKMIVVSMALDADAFPWHGDWYSEQVREALREAYDDQFRHWYVDNADHNAPARTERLIDYTGILQQALRDVSAWVEQGIAPAPSTHHSVEGGQLSLPSAATRGGIQPVVDLTADGANRAEVTVGQSVRLQASAEVPHGTGAITEISWDTDTSGNTVTEIVSEPRSALHAETTISYDKPGTYYPQIRVTVHRDPARDRRFAAIQNMARVRVVVRPGKSS
ncbi:Tat pathway signal sequence domain protein [Mycolicibacterium vinylchloridicum]|uniref:Tat pathway signal sequence domain protein n=1 Tax=Mycolicibacterium vinylchloridicum TaxID=2736928 RepID=UPI0015CA8351|nr:Tat pathway signal sequence domain protein [Mycolicibacterium vinylchloridicum]